MFFGDWNLENQDLAKACFGKNRSLVRLRSPARDRHVSDTIIILNRAKRDFRFSILCRTVIENVLVPLVARYGIEIGLWREDYPGYGLVIKDDDFIDFLEESFHQDFKLVGSHCDHMRKAIAQIKREKPAELRVWIDRKLRQYLTLKTVVRGPVSENQPLNRLQGPRDRFSDQHDSAGEILA